MRYLCLYLCRWYWGNYSSPLEELTWNHQPPATLSYKKLTSRARSPWRNTTDMLTCSPSALHNTSSEGKESAWADRTCARRKSSHQGWHVNMRGTSSHAPRPQAWPTASRRHACMEGGPSRPTSSTDNSPTVKKRACCRFEVVSARPSHAVFPVFDTAGFTQAPTSVSRCTGTGEWTATTKPLEELLAVGVDVVC